MFKQTILVAAVAGLVLALGPSAQAGTILDTDPLVTTLGLSEGDIFRMVFVTSTTTQATSTDIGYYNTFVTLAANSEGSLVAGKGWDWYAICSTLSVSAKSNTNTSETGYPIYLVGGGANRVADNYTDLWDGGIDRQIRRDEGGHYLQTGYPWTGTNKNGGRRNISGTYYVLGAIGGLATRGDATYSNDKWVAAEPLLSTDGFRPLYALSGPITVVPEPATVALLSLGCIGMLLGRRRVRG